MRRIYENPPIKEVVCEFIFDDSSPWDVTIPGVLYERLKEKYPKRGTQQNVEAMISGNERGIEGVSTHSIDVALLQRQDGKAIIKLKPNTLTISHLQPYTRWEQFEPEILSVLKTYRSIAKPKKLARIGLRYLNEILFEQPSIDLEDYFNFYPHIGEQLPQNFGPFMLAIHNIYDNGSNLMRVQLRTGVTSNPNVVPIVLDVDCFTHPTNRLKFKDVPNWLKTAHERENEVFEGCIKDSLRDRFGLLLEGEDNGSD